MHGANTTTIPLVVPALPSQQAFAQLLTPGWQSGRMTLGPLVQQFEAEVAQGTGAAHVVAVSSCTAGLMLAYRALELPLGGEVICPAFTFAATVHAISWCGLVPVFVDVLLGTGTIDPEAVRQAMSPRTVAICPVNVFGLPPDLEPLRTLAQEVGIPVVYDGAQGIGSYYQGASAVNYVTADVISLSPSKVVTAGEGGLILTHDADLAVRVRELRDYGKASSGPMAREDMMGVGLSARMSEFHAALGLLNYQRREELFAERQRRSDNYRGRLQRLEGCHWQEIPADRTTTASYRVLRVTRHARRSRDEVQQELAKRGIDSRRYFFPAAHRLTAMHHVPHRRAERLDVAERLSFEALALPLFHSMTDDQFDRVVTSLYEILT